MQQYTTSGMTRALRAVLEDGAKTHAEILEELGDRWPQTLIKSGISSASNPKTPGKGSIRRGEDGRYNLTMKGLKLLQRDKALLVSSHPASVAKGMKSTEGTLYEEIHHDDGIILLRREDGRVFEARELVRA